MRMIYTLLDAGAPEIIATDNRRRARREPARKPLLAKDEEDALWLGAIAKGDAVAFQQLLARYKGLLCSTIFKVLNDSDETEDVYQEVSMRIWLCAFQYHSEKGRAITWLVSMARNGAIDRLRAKQRRSRWVSEYREDRSLVPEFGMQRDFAYDLPDRRERCRAVREQVEKLSKDQRESIELAFFKGLTQNEIAQRLGHPVGTIKARIRRGMIKMREPMMSLL
ncbi:MAG: sigma-70 family RNA polymerase sigma factor [Verrucomicrobiales bacterium]|nr:sigma-70 family RNA polymerase sigma factor [Verrucomicrobiales bacterium]